MHTLHLDDTARAALQQALDAELDDTRVQLRRTERSAYKASIREYADSIDGIARSLAPSVTLDSSQAGLIADVVRRDIESLRVESRHSATWRYKDELKARRAALGRVLEGLPAA
jgi:hypothetical protein